MKEAGRQEGSKSRHRSIMERAEDYECFNAFVGKEAHRRGNLGLMGKSTMRRDSQERS